MQGNDSIVSSRPDFEKSQLKKPSKIKGSENMKLGFVANLQQIFNRIQADTVENKELFNKKYRFLVGNIYLKHEKWTQCPFVIVRKNKSEYEFIEFPLRKRTHTRFFCVKRAFPMTKLYFGKTFLQL